MCLTTNIGHLSAEHGRSKGGVRSPLPPLLERGGEERGPKTVTKFLAIFNLSELRKTTFRQHSIGKLLRDRGIAVLIFIKGGGNSACSSGP